MVLPQPAAVGFRRCIDENDFIEPQCNNYPDRLMVHEKEEEFNGLDQPILALEGAVPRQAVFFDTVKYLFVVATPTEVIILALTQRQEEEESPSSRLDIRTLDIIPSVYFAIF